MADESELSMMSKIAAQLVTQIIVDSDGITAGQGLPPNAPESVRVGHGIYSAVTGIPKEHLYYSSHEGLVSTNIVGRNQTFMIGVVQVFFWDSCHRGVDSVSYSD